MNIQRSGACTDIGRAESWSVQELKKYKDLGLSRGAGIKTYRDLGCAGIWGVVTNLFTLSEEQN